MTHDELAYREHRLRECFKDKLTELDVDGGNDICLVKIIKTYGALWHYTHQLLLAEEHESTRGTTTAETMNIQATGLMMKK